MRGKYIQKPGSANITGNVKLYAIPDTADIWLKFEGKLRSFILSRVHDDPVTDDILQELFIRIHANIDKLRDETKIQSWIYQIARNLITDHFRNLQKKNNLAAEAFGKNEETEPAEDYMSEALEDMVNMMNDLPPEYCEALCLTELGGMSQKAYAEKLGISYSGAKSRVQRARKILKDMLMNCCHYEFDKYGTVIGIYPVTCCCCQN